MSATKLTAVHRFKQIHHKQKVNSKVLGWFLAIETVDGRNPAPPEMYKTH